MAREFRDAMVELTQRSFEAIDTSEISTSLQEWIRMAASAGASSIQLTTVSSDHYGKITTKLEVATGTNLWAGLKYEQDPPSVIQLHWVETYANRLGLKTSLQREPPGSLGDQIVRLNIAWSNKS